MTHHNFPHLTILLHPFISSPLRPSSSPLAAKRAKLELLKAGAPLEEVEMISSRPSNAVNPYGGGEDPSLYYCNNSSSSNSSSNSGNGSNRSNSNINNICNSNNSNDSIRKSGYDSYNSNGNYSNSNSNSNINGIGKWTSSEKYENQNQNEFQNQIQNQFQNQNQDQFQNQNQNPYQNQNQNPHQNQYQGQGQGQGQDRLTSTWDESHDAIAAASRAFGGGGDTGSRSRGNYNSGYKSVYNNGDYNQNNNNSSSSGYGYGGGSGGGGNYNGGYGDNINYNINNQNSGSSYGRDRDSSAGSDSSRGGYSLGGGYTVPAITDMYVRTEDVKDHNAEMKSIFGHNGFREGQKECVEAALSGRDVFCLMPTGGGKSVVYQLPAWCSPGLSVIFSPLISLIQDQVDALTDIGIRAVFMSSTQDEAEGRQVFQDLFRYDASYRHSEDGSGQMEKRIKMLYITPERFTKSEALKKVLNQLHSQGMLSRFVIDEAHCLSQWGHDFRPDYLALTQIRGLYPNVPIMCLTATANQTVVADSISIMGMRDTYKHTMSFNRANLHYSVRKKETADKMLKSLAQTVRDRQGLTGIIYCLSKNDTETVATALKAEIPSMKNQITFYHADVAAEEKEKRQRSWSKGTIKVNHLVLQSCRLVYF
jgi:DEAD/DEAH box helicase